MTDNHTHTHTHTRLTALCPRLPWWAGTWKIKPVWILLEQETVSGSRISWTTCKSALRSKQIAMPAPHHSVFYRPDALPAAQPTVSKHWRDEHWRDDWQSVLSKCLNKLLPFDNDKQNSEENQACNKLLSTEWHQSLHPKISIQTVQ